MTAEFSKCYKYRYKHLSRNFNLFMCLRKTKNGSPKYPLYVKDDTKLIKFGELT
jgi:hypothetical protein